MQKFLRNDKSEKFGLLLDVGETTRGHEFHFSEWDAKPHERNPYQVQTASTPDLQGVIEGWSQGNALASYNHLHFGSHPPMAERFVTACWHWITHR